MKKIYTLTTRALNGTVTMMYNTSSFSSRELAEKAKLAVDEENIGGVFSIISDIEETTLFEDESEIPILNK